MANVRTPLAKAKATGRMQVNPGRYEDRLEASYAENTPLGSAPPHFCPIHVAWWDQTKKEIFWLRESDRVVTELLVKLRVVELTATGFNASRFNALMKALTAVGGTPTSRSGIHLPQEQRQDLDDLL